MTKAMPELPEVEYVRRHLEEWLYGARIVATKGTDALVIKPKPKALALAKGHTVEAVERRGKRLRIVLDGGLYLFSHLGMSGDWEFAAIDGSPRRFERLRLDVEKGDRQWSVRYVDGRRLGRFEITKNDPKSWSALGPDVLADGIDVPRWAAKLATRKKQSIKEALLDQTILAGVGNIQATEALWKAKIDPRTAASALEKKRLGALARGIQWTIDRTLSDLETNPTRWQEGGGEVFEVYGRKGEPCRRCKKPYKRIELGGRTTTFCPGCQR